MKAAVLVPIYEDGDGNARIVLTKRPGHMRTHAGDVVFPGGRVEEDDGGPIETALREAWEEIRLPPESVEVIGGLNPVTTRDPDNMIVPVVARVKRPDEFVPDPAEVEVVLEPTIEELLDETRWEMNDYFGHPLWFFEFPNGIMWGATAFVVRDLLSHVR